jgi:hypothetical protein
MVDRFAWELACRTGIPPTYLSLSLSIISPAHAMTKSIAVKQQKKQVRRSRNITKRANHPKALKIAPQPWPSYDDLLILTQRRAGRAFKLIAADLKTTATAVRNRYNVLERHERKEDKRDKAFGVPIVDFCTTASEP